MPETTIRPAWRAASFLQSAAIAERGQLGVRDVRAVGFVREETRLGQVGREDVRHVEEPPHRFGEVLVVSGVELSVIAHHGIDADYRLGRAERREEPQDEVDLLVRAEESGLDRVEAQVELAPFGDVVVEMGRVVRPRERVEARVVGEEGRRHGAALHLHRREDRDGNGERAPPEAREVVDDRSLLLRVVVDVAVHE